MAKILDVTANEILGLEKNEKSRQAGRRSLLRRMRQIERLPRRDQQAIFRTIDAFLTKSQSS